MFLCGMLLTLVTLAVIPSEPNLVWGSPLLRLCGYAVWLSEALAIKNSGICGSCRKLCAFFCFQQVSFRNDRHFRTSPLVSLPASWYSQSWLFPLGFPVTVYFSGLLPADSLVFLYLTGFYLWRVVMNGSLCEKIFAIPQRRPLAWLGRHSLWIYLLHQPALMAVTAILNYCL